MFKVAFVLVKIKYFKTFFFGKAAFKIINIYSKAYFNEKLETVCKKSKNETSGKPVVSKFRNSN